MAVRLPKPDRFEWAVILLALQALTATAFEAAILYLLAYVPMVPVARVHHIATMGYGFLGITALSTTAFAVGSWLGNIKFKASKEGVEIDAEGDEPQTITATAKVEVINPSPEA